jgi:hypothetical protein
LKVIVGSCANIASSLVWVAYHFTFDFVLVKTHFWDQVDFRPILELALDQNCATTSPILQLQNALMMVSR